jgi:Holliday junction resolvasome RuvABC endonuclease subunit
MGLVTGEYAANKVKKSVVGSGHAEKHQIGMMVKMLLPTCGQVSEDEADALAVAITHAHYRKSRAGATPTPAKQKNELTNSNPRLESEEYTAS